VTVRLDGAYVVDDRVAIRPEPFGALCYHYGNRRLTFLRSKDVLAVVESLGSQPTVADALRAAGVDERRWPTFVRALSQLESSELLHER
jgi:putative mycofactocin binding protein MftB